MPKRTDAPTLIPIAEQRLASVALRRLCKPVQNGKGRLLYLVGAAGSGKSALLTEFFREFNSPQVTTIQITASEFASQLAEASKEQRLPEFQERFRSVSVLICEDVQTIEGRPQTQQQLLATIDDLLAHGSDVIVSSTKLPGQLNSFPNKLVNRFRGGTIANIKMPDPDSRANLLRLFARQQRLTISRDALTLLAESFEATPRELVGVVTQLAESHKPVKRVDVEHFLQREVPTNSVTPLIVSRAVAKEFGLTLSALRSSRRSQALVLPRQCAMWLCRKLCAASYPELGAFFERQHSSVLHAVQKLQIRLDKEPTLRQRLARLEAVCR